MSNSSLVNYTKISPNKTVNRNHKIDTITIHCVVGQCSVETLGNIFSDPSKEASSNYGIGYDGKIKYVYPQVKCNMDLDENYSADYLRKFIPKLRDLLEEQLNNSLIIKTCEVK